MITETLMFLYAPFHARGLALETAVCSRTFILFKILGYTIVAVYSLIDPSLSHNPDNGTKLRV